MFSRRLLSTNSRSFLSFIPSRPFSATHITLDVPPRAPSLADITPDGVASFDAKQKEFRTKTAAAQRAREEQESQSLRGELDSSDSIVPSSSTSHSINDPPGLGSLSTADTEAKAAAGSENANKRKGPLSTLIYGTEEGRQMDREIERSYSQVLARGKYVHSIVFHKVKPDHVDEYVELVGRWYPRMARMEENKVNLVGSWRTEVGDCDTFGKFFSCMDLMTRNIRQQHVS